MQPTPQEQPAVNPWIVAIAVMFGTFMEVLDTTVVNVSLPHIAGSLSATIDEATWVITSYLVANAIDPADYRLAGELLRAQAIAHDVGHRIHRRFVPLRTGADAATADFLPNYSGRCRRRAAATFAGCVAGILSAANSAAKRWVSGAQGIVVAPIIGPVLGGWLTDTYSWRWVFYINIPGRHRVRSS